MSFKDAGLRLRPFYEQIMQQKNTSTQTTESARPRWLRGAEQALLILVLSAAALRATFIETPHVESFGQTGSLSNEAISLLLSSVLLAAPAVWVILCGLSGGIRRRSTYFTAACMVFCGAGLAGVFFASDKRAALTDLTVLMSGPAAGLMAIQLMDRRETVRLFLWLLLGVGVAATYACYDKMTSSNAQLIAEYEKNPDAFLKNFGIEAGSLDHWQYEHRLYSQDVSGFLTTSNSAGSFFLLAVFAGIGLCIEAFRARGNEETLVALICVLLATLFVLAGLLMTQSKGALGAFGVFAVILAGCVLLRTIIWRYRYAVCATAAVLALAAAAALTLYGVRHGRLPGGNSMLVRWQYWASSGQIVQDHPVLGAGGGNFVTAYMRHKNPAASETISDPHNWVFSLLCRFGIAGFAAMGWAMIRPAGRLFAAAVRPVEAMTTGEVSGWRERFLWLGLLGGVMGAMLIIRPKLFTLDGPGQSAMEHSAAFLLLIIIPAGIIALVLGLLRFSGAGDASLHRSGTGLITAIACGLGAVLLHNMVDFALFEPGVWTMFWLMAGAGLALVDNTKADGGFRFTAVGTAAGRATFIAGPMVAAGAVLLWVVIPPVRRGAISYEALSVPPGHTEAYLEQAVAVDPLSPDAAIYAARLLMYRSGQHSVVKHPELLSKARAFAETGIARTPEDPRPRRLRGEILLATAENAGDDDEKKTLQEEAYRTLQEAVRLYPGSDVIHYKLGVLAEELAKPDQAKEHLEKALSIETAYRAQFRVMYPNKADVVSRLGPKVYADLLDRLERLGQDRQKITDPIHEKLSNDKK